MAFKHLRRSTGLVSVLQTEKTKKKKNRLFEELFMLSGYETLGAEIDYRTIGS
jgi:hypothetical protein